MTPLPGQAEVIEAISARYSEAPWLRRRRLEAWRLCDDLSDGRIPSTSGIERDGAGGRVSRAIRVWSGLSAGLIEHQGRDAVLRRSNPTAAKQGVVFSDLHSASREHASLVRQRLMSVVPPHEDGDEARNAALWSGGAFLYVPAGVAVEEPFRYVGGGEGDAIFRRVLLVAERDSGATFVDAGVPTGRGPAAADSVAEVVLAEGARVRYVTLVDWGKSVPCRFTLRALLERGSHLELMVVDTGGATTRAKLEAVLTGRGAAARIVVLALADGDQRLDYSTLQEHRAPETVSDLLFKSALGGRARLQWRGLTRVYPGATGSDANQESRSLLLGDRAQARPMPVLEIEAYDVSRCSHGATVSSVDEEQRFYLMSRGLSSGQAEAAIVEGFFQQGLDTLSGDGVRSGVERVLRRKMAAGRRWERGRTRGMR